MRRISCIGIDPRGICGLIGVGAPSEGDSVLLEIPGRVAFERRTGNVLPSLPDADIGGEPAFVGEAA